MSKKIDYEAWSEKILEKAKQREGSAALSVNTLSKIEAQMPLWPEATRGVPNGVLRSALFGAIKKGPRSYIKRQAVAALEGIAILYSGPRLDQWDLDVWECVLHIARLQKMGQKCRFTAYAILKMMGKSDTGENRKILHENLMHLKANAVEVKQGQFSYIGSLIKEVYRDEETKEYIIVLDANLCPLFSDDQFTQIDWNVRLALKGKPLAQWLHGFYSSHAKPYPMKVATLLELSGSENNDPYSAQQKLIKSLDALCAACEANGQPFSYEVKKGLIHTLKAPSASQRRHLERKGM
jgi:TrfA protein